VILIVGLGGVDGSSAPEIEYGRGVRRVVGLH